MMLNSISVIIPSLNRQGYVENLLVDLSHQTRKADEVIVIDQSRQPYNLDNCVYISMLEKLGPCQARNVGMEKATGEILVFLDDDIHLPATFLEEITQPILDESYRVVVGAMADGQGNYLPPYDQPWKVDTAWWLNAMTANPCFPGRRISLGFTTCCAAVRRSVFQDIGLFDSFFDPDGAGEDRELGLRMYFAGIPILFNGAAKVHHFGDPVGGRRAVPSLASLVESTGKFDVTEFTPLEKNLVYITAKHFGPKVFRSHCRAWLLSTLMDRTTLNPVSWIRVIRRYHAAKKWIAHVESLFA